MWLSKRVGFGRNRKECEHFSRTNFMEMKTTLLASDCPTSERERERPTIHAWSFYCLHPIFSLRLLLHCQGTVLLHFQSSQCSCEQSPPPPFQQKSSFTFSKTKIGMGTKLEYAINLLATSHNSSSVSVRCVDDLEYLQTRGLRKDLQVSGIDKFCSSMDRMPEKHNIDFIKKTMQLHDDIFKQQVRELHRLYSVQKMLMDELNKNEIKQNRKYWTPMTSSYTNYSQFANRPKSTEQTTCGYSFLVQRPRDDPSSRERSGSCSDETMRLTRGFDLERLAEHISTGVGAVDENQAGPSTCAPQKGKMSIDGSDEDSEVELTLSIGGSTTSKKISKNYQTLELDSPASFIAERGEDYSTPTTPMSSSSATCGQDRKRPHWLFQKV